MPKKFTIADVMMERGHEFVSSHPMPQALLDKYPEAPKMVAAVEEHYAKLEAAFKYLRSLQSTMAEDIRREMGWGPQADFSWDWEELTVTRYKDIPEEPSIEGTPVHAEWVQKLKETLQ